MPLNSANFFFKHCIPNMQFKSTFLNTILKLIFTFVYAAIRAETPPANRIWYLGFYFAVIKGEIEQAFVGTSILNVLNVSRVSGFNNFPPTSLFYYIKLFLPPPWEAVSINE